MKDNEKILWTRHALDKMRHYRLSESRLKRIIRHPARVEEGVLEDAIACMQPSGGKKYSEIWVMYVLVGMGGFRGDMFSRPDSSAPAADFANSQAKFSRLRREPSKLRPPLSRKHITSTAHQLFGGSKIKIITAWRYPGKSPARDPIPAEILREIKNIL